MRPAALAASLLLACCCCALARATPAPDRLNSGDSGGAFIDLGGPRRVPTALDSVPHPWPGIALSLSVIGTAAPILLMGLANRSNADARVGLSLLAAEIVTPAAGHLYAGLYPRAGAGIVARTVGFGAMAVGAASEGVWSDQSSSEFGSGAVPMLLGAAVMAGSAIVDIVTVPGDVDLRNAEWLRTHASVGVRMAPDATPELAFAVRF